MIRVAWRPSARAASTNSFSRKERNSPRMIRAVVVQSTAARMKASSHQSPPPRVRPRQAAMAISGDGEQQVDEPHQTGVDPAAEVARDGPDENAEDGGERAPRSNAISIDFWAPRSTWAK